MWKYHSRLKITRDVTEYKVDRHLSNLYTSSSYHASQLQGVSAHPKGQTCHSTFARGIRVSAFCTFFGLCLTLFGGNKLRQNTIKTGDQFDLFTTVFCFCFFSFPLCIVQVISVSARKIQVRYHSASPFVCFLLFLSPALWNTRTHKVSMATLGYNKLPRGYLSNVHKYHTVHPPDSHLRTPFDVIYRLSNSELTTG